MESLFFVDPPSGDDFLWLQENASESMMAAAMNMTRPDTLCCHVCEDTVAWGIFIVQFVFGEQEQDEWLPVMVTVDDGIATYYCEEDMPVTVTVIDL